MSGRPTPRGRPAAAVLLVAVVALLAAAAAGAAPVPAWDAAADVRARLGDAEKALLLDGPAPAGRLVAGAERAYARGLRTALRAEAPRLAARLESSLAAAARAAAGDDPAAFATARAAAWTAVLGASYRGAASASAAGDARAAEGWLLVREYRPPTRFSRAAADATLAVAALGRGRESAAAASAAVRADLLDTYQGRLRVALEEVTPAAASGFGARAAQTAALARGYWDILADAYAAQRGAAARRATSAAFERLVLAATAGRARAAAATAEVNRRLEGFRAAPLSSREEVRRAGQLRRFVKLVPVEYGRGVHDGRVTLDFEVQEAVTFRDGAGAAFDDLEPALLRRDPRRTREMGAELRALRTDLADAVAGTRVASPDAVQDRAERVLALSDAAFPEAWTSADASADFDVIDATLDRMQAAAAAGDYGKAEQARLEAYAIFEFGPEQRLRGLAQDLFVKVEGLFWYGTGDDAGLVQLLTRKAGGEEIARTRTELDAALMEAAKAVGDGPKSLGTVVTNTAIIVFREGLEAVLILAALMGSMRGLQRGQRRPMWAGVGLALVATAVTWVIAQTVLSSLNRYGERLEAIVSLVAIAVLLLILNWFFHKVYWTGHLSTLHGRKRGVLGGRDRGFLTAQFVGLAALGFTSIYREGFETVLFLQSLVLAVGVPSVLLGVAVGLAATVAVGVAAFALQRRLPYKRMLVLTGVLVAWVLVIMVGTTVQVLQSVGWVPVTPIAGLRLPYWVGLWFGVFPTWEGILAQVGAIVVVAGSYVAAEGLKRRRSRTRSAAARAAG